MQTKYLLLTLWIIAVLIGLINHYYYQNQKRELEYRRKKFAQKQLG